MPFQRGEADMSGYVAAAWVAEDVFARLMATIAHQRSGWEAFGLGGGVAVVDREDVAGREALRDSVHPAERVQIYFGGGAVGGVGEVAVNVVADFGRYWGAFPPDEAVISPID